MNPFLRRPLAAALLGFITAFAATASASPKAAWRIEVGEDKDGNPHSRVDLVINDQQVVHIVSPNSVSKYSVLVPADYAEHKVPAEALCACTSWWAGAGTDYYVIRSEGKLDLFRLDVDEGKTGGRYKKDRSIKFASP